MDDDTESIDLGDWPDELPRLSQAAHDQVERWTRQRLLVFHEGAWVEAEDVPDEALDDDSLYPAPLQPRMWVGCHLQYDTGGWYLLCRLGLRRTGSLRASTSPYSDTLIRAVLTAEVLGDGALPDLRSAVSLAFGLGLVSWAERPRGRARG